MLLSRRRTRTRAVCAHIRCTAPLHVRAHTRIRARVRARTRYRISPVVHGARCTCSSRARVSRAQKPRARASSRSRMLGMRLPRSAANRGLDKRERERGMHSVSFRDDTPVICSLSRSREQRGGSVRYRPRSYANKLRGAFYRAADRRASRSRGVTLFSWSPERIEPVSPRVSTSNLNETRGRKFDRRSPALWR